MFVSIIGTRAAGKTAIEQYLVSRYRFRPVRLNGSTVKLSLFACPVCVTAYNVHQSQKNTSLGDPYGGGSNNDSKASLIDNSNINGVVVNGASADFPVPLFFGTASDMLDYVTRHWKETFVSCDLDNPHLIELFIKRPFFLLVSVDAPLLVRHARILSLVPNLTLDAFVEEHDTLLYGKRQLEEAVANPSPSLNDMFRISNVHIINAFDSIDDLHSHLNKIDIPDPNRLRPQWDTYFMTLADLASQRSNCMKRRVGAILVRDKRILSTGYNGTPRNVRNCNEGGCHRCNSGVASGSALDECLCLHAEENALLEAGRERVGEQAVLYCNTCPCLGCAIKIVQTGVKEVVYNLSYKVDERTATLFKEAGVKLRQHSPPQ